MNSHMNLREWGLLIVLAVLWGGAFFGVDLAVDDFGPLTIVSGRVAIGALIMWLLIVILRMPTFGGRVFWRQCLMMGVLNNIVPFSLISWGQTEISGSLAATLVATTPMFSVLLAHFWSREEPLTRGRVFGIGLGIAGVAVLVDAPIATHVMGSFWGQMAMLGAAFSYGVAAIYGRRLGRFPPFANAAGQLTMSSCLILPICLWIEHPWSVNPSALNLGALVGVAVFSTGLAYAVYFRLLASAGATNVLLVTLLVPVSATALSILFLDEALTLVRLVGMGLILIGLLAIDGRMFRRSAAAAG